jgi:hypothetical protein
MLAVAELQRLITADTCEFDQIPAEAPRKERRPRKALMADPLLRWACDDGTGAPPMTRRGYALMDDVARVYWHVAAVFGRPVMQPDGSLVWRSSKGEKRS